MKPPISSIETLRAFDAAIRLGNFSRAAEAVHLTHGAVSRRIAALEAAVRTPLFERLPRGVRATEAGLRLHVQVLEALEILAGGIADLRRGPRPDAVVRLSVLPSFASRWLLPRLALFRARHPQIEVQIVAELGFADFARDRIDLAIRYGLGRWPRSTSEHLMTEWLYPVAAARKGKQRFIGGPEDLVGKTILHDQNEDSWDSWLDAIGWRPPKMRSEIYNDYTLALDAAANGLGIAMGRSRLIEIDLRNGRLARASAFQVPSPRSYYLVTPRRGASGETSAFMAWLRAAASADSSGD